MLLSLPKLQYAGVNPLLLHVNKQALFIHHSVCKITGVVSLFLFSQTNLIQACPRLHSVQPSSPSQVIERVNARTSMPGRGLHFSYQIHPFLSLTHLNKRRDMV